MSAWRCPTCGATNTGEGNRCRICRLLAPPGAVPTSNPAAAAPAAAPPPPPPPAGAPADPPPPGGSYPPPPLYPPPPPGWYPGAPAPKKTRPTLVIVVSVVVPVLVVLTVVIVVGVNYARGVDPEAAKDRDAAEAALVTSADLGGAFKEVGHRSFARSRGGVRVEGGLAECGAANGAFAQSGQAVVDSVLQAQSGLSAQVVAEEVLVVKSPAQATPVVDAIVGTARSCVAAGVRDGAGTRNVTVSLEAAPAPVLGDRAAAFDGAVGFQGASASVTILVVQQGRAVVVLLAADTTGTLQGKRLAALASTLLARLVPRFGA